MNNTIVAVLLCVGVLGSGVFLTTATAQDERVSIEDAIDAAESVNSGLEVPGTPLQYIAGAVVGAGIGLFLGSSIIFQYWRRTIG